jgi:hypothetical protein
MDDAEKIRLVTALLTRHDENHESDDGDKYLSDTEYAMQALIDIVLYDSPENALKMGFIDA